MNASGTVRAKVEAYLISRRHAGFALRIEGYQLERFARFADQGRHRGPLTMKVAVHWATATRRSKPLTAARGLEVLRPFFRYCQQFDPETAILPPRLFGPGHRRLTPHIYTDEEIRSLLAATAHLHPAGGLRGASCATIFGLIAATGLRISEATGLQCEDVDLERGLLRIRHTKFGNSRWVPLHPTTTRALQRYEKRRDTERLSAATGAFFIFDYGRPALTRSVEYAFQLLRRRLKWRTRGGHPVPRIHDLRHGFVCRRLQRWYEEGLDIDLYRTRQGYRHILVCHRHPGVIGTGRAPCRTRARRCRMSTPAPLSFPCLLQQFFVERLMQQLHVSPRTVAAYRDSFRLLLAFAHRRLGKRPTDLTLQDLTASMILKFLKHLEAERHNCIRSRNARFAAIRSFMDFVAFQEPSAISLAQSVLAIPMKRFEQPLIGFLTREHIEAIQEAPDQCTWTGRRDRVMLAVLYNTGARVSELIGMRLADLVLEPSASVRIRGKGRKERSVPLWPRTAAQLKRWLREYPRGLEQPLFPNRSGGPMTRVGVTERLKIAAKIAARQFPELAKQRVFPHLVRHSIAMHMLQAGVDITVIALWLGHESPVTTHRYVEADLARKERALKSLEPPRGPPLRYRPTDPVLQFLQGL